MEEFQKTLRTLHQTLMLGTGAILAFALSSNPIEELAATREAVKLVRTIDVNAYTKSIEAEIFKPDEFARPGIWRNTESERVKTFEACLGNKINVSYKLAVVVYPDIKTVSISELLEELGSGKVLFIEADKSNIAELVARQKPDCEAEYASGLRNILIRSGDPDVMRLESSRPEIFHITSRALTRYQKDVAPDAPQALRENAMLVSFAKTGIVDLEYPVSNGKRTERISGGGVVSPSIAIVNDAFRRYLPEKTGAAPEVRRLLNRHLGLIGDKTPDRALEILETVIDQKSKHPTIYGVEIASVHASWGIPAITLALIGYLLVHLRAFRRLVVKTRTVLAPFPSALTYSGRGAALVRGITLCVAPAIANATLIQRLGSPTTPAAVIGFVFCAATVGVGLGVLFELERLRRSQGNIASEAPSGDDGPFDS